MFTGIVQQVGIIYSVNKQQNASSYEIQLPVEFCRNLLLGASMAHNGCCLTTRKVDFHMNGKVLSDDALESALAKNEYKDVDLTVVSDKYFALVHFDLISTTLELTNLKDVKKGTRVNVERSFTFGSEVGGHILSGHIETTIPVANIVDKDNVYQIEFELPARLKPYFMDKGFVAVDGMSLTISSITDKGFTVNVIPETLARTTIKDLKVGSRVNLEIDTQTRLIVDTVERYLKGRKF